MSRVSAVPLWYGCMFARHIKMLKTHKLIAITIFEFEIMLNDNRKHSRTQTRTHKRKKAYPTVGSFYWMQWNTCSNICNSSKCFLFLAAIFSIMPKVHMKVYSDQMYIVHNVHGIREAWAWARATGRIIDSMSTNINTTYYGIQSIIVSIAPLLCFMASHSLSLSIRTPLNGQMPK